MAASLSGVWNAQELTSLGALAAGYRLYTYTPSTTTKKNLYTDSAASVPFTYTSDGAGGEYIALNSRGELSGTPYLSSGGYDFVLKDTSGSTIWTRTGVGIDDAANSAAAAVETSILTDLADTSDAANGDALIGVKRTATGATAITLHEWIEEQVFNAADFGMVGDGSTNNATAFQAALDALASTGGVLYIPPASSFYSFASTINVPASVGIIGGGKWATILRYTGTGTAFIGKTSGTETVSTLMADFSIQLTGNNAIAFDCSRWISSTFRSVRTVTASGTGQVHVYANITNVAWTSYYNEFIDHTFDGAVANAVQIKTTVAQNANRWRFISPTFLSNVNSFDLQGVQGIQIVAPYFNEHTGIALKLGAAADRVTIVNAVQETNSGGSMWSVDAACNRLTVLGYESFAGTDGSGSGMGIRALVIQNWDGGIFWTGSSTATAISGLAVGDNGGVQQTGSQSISSTTTAGNNLCGTDTFATAATRTVSFARAEPDASYRVFIMGRANENFWVTSPTVNGFTANSSNATSAAQFDWFIVR